MRIVIIGTSGTGKTTLAKRLAKALDLPHVELDAVNWQPGWRGLSHDDPDEFRRRVHVAADGAEWICDGNYSAARSILWPRATHLVWLDYNRSVVMTRVVLRSASRALVSRELWAGNREDWRRWFRASHPIRWAWSTWKHNRARYEAALGHSDFAHLTVIRLRRPREAGTVTARLGSKA